MVKTQTKYRWKDRSWYFDLLNAQRIALQSVVMSVVRSYPPSLSTKINVKKLATNYRISESIIASEDFPSSFPPKASDDDVL